MSDKVPTAKVYVWKDEKMGEEGKPWKVGLMSWGELLVIVQDCETHEEAWQWLYENYKRETP